MPPNYSLSAMEMLFQTRTKLYLVASMMIYRSVALDANRHRPLPNGSAASISLLSIAVLCDAARRPPLHWRSV